MEIDSTYLQDVRTDSRYDYLRAIDSHSTTTKDISRESRNAINDFLYENIDALKVVSLVVVLAVIFLILWQIIRRFAPTYEADDSPSGMGSDTIYNHDWEREINQAMDRNEYSEAVVLCYLRWLDKLNSDGIIRFARSKTPGIFLNEVENYKPAEPNTDGQAGTINKTRTLTRQYLLVRYGHRQASEALAKEMLAL